MKTESNDAVHFFLFFIASKLALTIESSGVTTKPDRSGLKESQRPEIWCYAPLNHTVLEIVY